MAKADRKITVLQIIGNLRFGGTQVVVKQIVEHTDPDQFQHVVFSLRAKPNEMSIKGEIIEHTRFPYDIRKFFDLVKICREKKINIVHAHLYKSILGGLLLTFFCPVRVIIHEHGPIYRVGFSRFIYQFLLFFLHKRAAAIIANSRTTMQALHRYAAIDPNTVDVIPNAVVPNRFEHNAEQRVLVRRQFGFQDNNIVIGFIGRLHPVKGVDCLVKAMRILIQQNALFRLVIVGSGPLEKTLKQTTQKSGLKQHVFFAGYHEDVSAIMNIFDIGCMPSRQESFGIAAIEMMSMKIPLVCSRVEGLVEITEHRKTAFHLDRVSPEAIADSILELSKDPQLCRQLGDNGFLASRQYHIEHFIEKIESLYRRIT